MELNKTSLWTIKKPLRIFVLVNCYFFSSNPDMTSNNPLLSSSLLVFVLLMVYGLASSSWFNNCSAPDCRTVDCSNLQLTSFDCPATSSPNFLVQKLLLQNNYITFFSVPDIQNCFPNIRFINLYGNKLKNLECGPLTTKFEVIYNCSILEKKCSPLKLPTCCCFAPFKIPIIDPCSTLTTMVTSTSSTSLQFTTQPLYNSSAFMTTSPSPDSTAGTTVNSTYIILTSSSNIGIYVGLSIVMFIILCLTCISFLYWWFKIRVRTGRPQSEESSEDVIFENRPYVVRTQSMRVPTNREASTVPLRRTVSLRFSHRPRSISEWTVPVVSQNVELQSIARSCVRGSITQRNPARLHESYV